MLSPNQKLILFMKNVIQKPDILSVSDILEMTSSRKEFYDNLKEMSKNVDQIVKWARGQRTNKLWFEFRKGVVTASKCRNILTKMLKMLNGGGGYVAMNSINQRVSGLTYTDPNVPVLKYA